MASKSKPRSVRLSMEAEELVDQQIGDGFTEKLENLIYMCCMAAEEKKKELAELDRQIKARQKKLDYLTGVWNTYSQRGQQIGYSIEQLALRLEKMRKEEV